MQYVVYCGVVQMAVETDKEVAHNYANYLHSRTKKQCKVIPTKKPFLVTF